MIDLFGVADNVKKRLAIRDVVKQEFPEPSDISIPQTAQTSTAPIKITQTPEQALAGQQKQSNIEKYGVAEPKDTLTERPPSTIRDIYDYFFTPTEKEGSEVVPKMVSRTRKVTPAAGQVGLALAWAPYTFISGGLEAIRLAANQAKAGEVVSGGLIKLLQPFSELAESFTDNETELHKIGSDLQQQYPKGYGELAEKLYTPEALARFPYAPKIAGGIAENLAYFGNYKVLGEALVGGGQKAINTISKGSQLAQDLIKRGRTIEAKQVIDSFKKATGYVPTAERLATGNVEGAAGQLAIRKGEPFTFEGKGKVNVENLDYYEKKLYDELKESLKREPTIKEMFLKGDTFRDFSGGIRQTHMQTIKAPYAYQMNAKFSGKPISDIYNKFSRVIPEFESNPSFILQNDKKVLLYKTKDTQIKLSSEYIDLLPIVGGEIDVAKLKDGSKITFTKDGKVLINDKLEFTPFVNWEKLSPEDTKIAETLQGKLERYPTQDEFNIAKQGQAGIPKPVPEIPKPEMAKELEPPIKKVLDQRLINKVNNGTLPEKEAIEVKKFLMKKRGVSESSFTTAQAKAVKPAPISPTVEELESQKAIIEPKPTPKVIGAKPPIKPPPAPPTTPSGAINPLDDFYNSLKAGNIPEAETKLPLHKLDPLNPTPIPENVNLHRRIKAAVKSRITSIREWVEDRSIRIKKLLDVNDAKIMQGEDVYSTMKLYPGRVDARLRLADDIVTEIDKGIVTEARELKIPDTAIIDDINKYLISKHAPERNAKWGEKAAGITTSQAKNNLIQLEKSPYFKVIKEYADKISELNHQTLDILRDSQVITDDLYNLLRKTYKDHIPLNRVFAETDDIVEVLSSRGFAVKGTGLKRAIGSEREIKDIMTNVVANYKSAIMRAEKNRVDLATLAFSRTPEMKASELFTEIKPKAIGKTFAGQPILEKITDPLVLSLREAGKPVYLRINDPNLAIAFQGVGKEYLPQTLKWIGSFTRLYSGLMTRFNPEFALPNMIRDLQEVMVYVSSQKDMGLKGAVRAATREGRSIKDIVDFLRGFDTEGTRLYKQLRMDGGTTGGMALSTRKQIEFDIAKIRALNRSNPKQAARYILDKVDKWNTIFEDATRLSVYQEALARGTTRNRAAILAKEASIDFNKMGRGGPIVNSIWMFSNASVQGTTKLLRAMKNPKVLATVTGGVTTAVITTNRYNDRVDPDWREKVTKWDRMNSLTIMIPGTDNYIAIPISWGLKPIKVMAESAYDFMVDSTDDIKETISTIMSSIMDAYNPTAGTDIVSGFTPTILDVPIELSRNRAWSGAKIKPDIKRRKMEIPESARYYPQLEESVAGRIAIKGTEIISDLGIEISPADINYAFQQYIGGTGRFLSKTITTAISLIKRELPALKEIPIISRFLRTAQEEARQDSALPMTFAPKVKEDALLERIRYRKKVRDSISQYKKAE